MHTHYDGACQIVHHGDEANMITKVRNEYAQKQPTSWY